MNVPEVALLLIAGVTACATVLLPGALVALALGLRGVTLFAASGFLSIAVTSGTAIALAPLHVPFTWGWVLVADLLVAGIIVGVRGFRGPMQATRGTLPVLLAILLSISAIGLLSFSGPGIEAVNTTYDGVFHLNAVAYSISTGDVSSFDLYRMTHPGTDVEFYPAAFHAVAVEVVQITGVSVPVAVNAAWLAAAGAIWVPGCVLLTTSIWRRPEHMLLAQVSAALVAACFAAFPYLMLDWGTLYPTALAYALLPAGLALVVLLVTRAAQRTTLMIGLIAAWGFSEAFAHPRSIFGFAVLVAPLLLSAVATRVGRAWQDPARRRRILVWGAGSCIAAVATATAGAVLVLRYFRVDQRPISDRLNGGPATAHQSIGASLLQVLGNAPPVSPSEAATPPTALLSVLVLVGLLVAIRRGNGWILVAYALVAVLYAAAAGSNSDLAKVLTGLWYKDKYRLIALLPVLGVPLAAIAVASAAQWAERWRRGWGAATGALLLALLVLVSLTGPSIAAVRSGIDSVYTIPSDGKDGALLDQDELDLLAHLPTLLPTDAVVVGDPWNGSALTWAVGQRQSLFPHFTGEWDEDRLTVAERLDQWATDGSVCAALGRLGAEYLFVSEGQLWGGDPQAAAFAGIDRTDPDTIGTLVARRGGSELYRITACSSQG